MKNVLLIRASARKSGNSNLLSDQFAAGCQAAGHSVTNIFLADYKIQMCLGCYSCETHGACCQHDDMAQLLPLLQQADVIAFATPVYFYSMAGQLKTFLDRTMPLYFKSCPPKKDVYLLTASESPDPSATDGTLAGIHGWIRCFPNITFKSGVYGLGVLKCGDIRGHAELNTAYALGKEV